MDIILDGVCICNNSDDAKQKEEGDRARRHLNTSAELGCSHRKNTCTEILYRPSWKSKEIIWANRHFTSLELEHLKCLPFISLFLTYYRVHEAPCRTSDQSFLLIRLQNSISRPLNETGFLSDLISLCFHQEARCGSANACDMPVVHINKSRLRFLYPTSKGRKLWNLRPRCCDLVKLGRDVSTFIKISLICFKLHLLFNSHCMMSITWHEMSLDCLLVSLNWRRVDTDSQQTLTFVCTWRIMWSEPLTHSTVMSWHTIATAQLWTISRARFPPSDSWTNLRAPYGAAPKMILSQTFHHSLFIKLPQPRTWGEDMQLGE